jgi:hypothetical protein
MSGIYSVETLIYCSDLNISKWNEVGRPTSSVGTDSFDRLGLVPIALSSEEVERVCMCVFGGRREGGKTSLEVQEINLHNPNSRLT